MTARIVILNQGPGDIKVSVGVERADDVVIKEGQFRDFNVYPINKVLIKEIKQDG